MVEQEIEQLSITSLVLRLAASEKGLELADTRSRNAETHEEMFKAEQDARYFLSLVEELGDELDKRLVRYESEQNSRKNDVKHLTKD